MIAILADAFVKATVLLLLAAGGTVLLRRSTAALRHLIWTLACGGVLVLPVASALLPHWRVAPWPNLNVPPAFDAKDTPIDQPSAEQTVLRPVPVAPLVRETSPTPVSTVDPTPVRVRLTPDWTAFVVPAWLSGVGFVLLLIAVGMVRIAWLDRVTKPLHDESWLVLLEDLSRELGLHRHVRLLQAAAPAMPMTWGVRRPAILLPAEAGQWPADRRRDVLLHELAHVKRQDFLTQLIARVACAVYWFHPLVWLAATRLREERERACDDQVLRAGATPSAYATHLLEIARGLRAARATSLASVAMARPAQLATRLIDVLDARRCRATLSPRSALPAWIAALAVVVPLAAVAPRVAEPASVLASIDTIPLLPSGRIKPQPRVPNPESPTRARRMPLVLVDTLRGCSGETKHRSSSTTRENEDLTIFVNLGGCSIRLAAAGKFTFTEDFTDIATVAAGGRVVIDVDYGAHDRRVTIRAGNDRVYKVDGETRPFDADARAWLTEVITYLLRRTGYEGEARARWILGRRGVQGLLDEITQLGGDYARRIYYQSAIESGRLDAAGYERLVADAGRTVSSDYELAELFIAVAKAQPLTERMQAGFVAASQSISSDYERHRVLKAALSRPGLSAAVQTGMLDAAAGINSDYELAELLIEVNAARQVDDSVRPAYFKAANSLQSDFEHRRVLKAVVAREGTSPAILADALNSAKGISSDFELAELLVQVGSAYPLDDVLRPAFFAAAATLNSDFERAHALRSVLRGDVSGPVALGVLASARGISSDHELAELLIVVITQARLDDTLRAAVRASAETISSQYDRGRVFEALSRE